MKKILFSPKTMITASVFLIIALVALFIIRFFVHQHQTKASISHYFGTMLMVGFRGQTLDSIQPPSIQNDIKEGRLGGIILFNRDTLTKTTRNIKNPSQLTKLTSALQNLNKDPLFIAIDEEGGIISRLKDDLFDLKTPSHGKLGKVPIEASIQTSVRIAQRLSELGINVNFAPVVDLCQNQANPIIARFERCFHQDPNRVYQHANAFVQSYLKFGILPVIKHFPGHGSATADSHKELPDITDHWHPKELIPFQKLIEQDIALGVMTAHILHRHYDSDHPASLSPFWIQAQLREQMKHQGLIFTDDLQMSAITERYSLKETIIQSIQAGNDILIFGNNLGTFNPNIVEEAHLIVQEAIAQKELNLSQLKQSYKRILAIKSKL